MSNDDPANGGPVPALHARARGRRRADRSLAFLDGVSAVLEVSGGSEQTLLAAARLCVPVFADFAVVSVEREDGVRSTAVAHVDPAQEFALERVALRGAFLPPHEMLAVENKWIIDDVGDELTALGTRSLLAAPLAARGRTVGMIAFGASSTSHRAFDAFDVPIAHEAARRIALALENARLYEREQTARDAEREARAVAEAAEARADFLSRASAILGESLDVGAALPLVAHMCTPLLSDWCVFDVDLGARAVYSAHVDSTREALVRGVDRVPEVDATGHALASMATLFPSEGSRLAVGALGANAFMIVPLAVAGHAVGALLFVRADEGPTYGPGDVALARELARRVALAVDHARLYAQAREAVSVRDRLTAVVMHDLRNPLAAIRLAAEALLASSLSDGPRRNCESIRRCTRHMASIVEDLVEVSRLETNLPAVDLRPEPASALLRAALELVAPLAAAKRIRVEAPPPADSLKVTCDARRVLQVLSNILGNAIKFTPERGHVSIECGPLEGHVRFVVKDSGPGIPLEQRARIFEPFWRADDKSPGLGLGLAIARGIVEAHGGSIGVEGAGGGCALAFTLRRA